MLTCHRCSNELDLVIVERNWDIMIYEYICYACWSYLRESYKEIDLVKTDWGDLRG